MDPTFVAPTATIEKNPCSHCPTYTARSFKLNRPLTKRAIPGFTLNNSPVQKKLSKITSTKHLMIDLKNKCFQIKIVIQVSE